MKEETETEGLVNKEYVNIVRDKTHIIFAIYIVSFGKKDYTKNMSIIRKSEKQKVLIR